MNKKSVGLLGIEHIILNIIINIFAKGEYASSEDIINEFNNLELDKLTYKKLSKGSIYGNISNLYKKDYITKKLVGGDSKQKIAYILTPLGTTVRNDANNRLKSLVNIFI